MKGMKKSLGILAVLVALFFAQTAFAQGHRGGGKGHLGEAQRLEKMTKELSLTEKQQAAIKQIFEEGKPKMKAIRESENEAGKREAMKALRAEQEAAVNKVLTKDQIAKAEQLKAARKEEMKKNHAARKETHKAVKEELKAYKAKNMEPVLKAQRAKLEKDLTAADKKAISEINANLAANKKQMEAKKEAFKASGKKRDEVTEADKAEFKKLHELRKTEMDKAEVIAKKYDKQINGLLEEVKPQAEQWKADMKAIKEKHKVAGDKMHGDKKGKEDANKKGSKMPKGDKKADRPDRFSDDASDKKNGENPAKKGEFRKEKEHKKEGRKDMKAVRFLLLESK